MWFSLCFFCLEVIQVFLDAWLYGFPQIKKRTKHKNIQSTFIWIGLRPSPISGTPITPGLATVHPICLFLFTPASFLPVSCCEVPWPSAVHRLCCAESLANPNQGYFSLQIFYFLSFWFVFFHTSSLPYLDFTLFNIWRISVVDGQYLCLLILSFLGLFVLTDVSPCRSHFLVSSHGW